MLLTANVSNQTWHSWSVGTFGCQTFKKWPLIMYFLWEVTCTCVKIYYYIGNLIVVNCFQSKWASVRGINGDTGLKIKTELDANLRSFYAEAWNKDGENYSSSTLLWFRNGLDRYLNNPRTRKASTLLPTQRSNQMRSTGSKTSNINPCHWAWRPAASEKSAVITSIQCLVSCQPVFQFCRCGQEGKRNLTKSSFLFLQDENSEWYATMGHEEASKTGWGG